jgi:ADP-ribosylglycohydrolase
MRGAIIGDVVGSVFEFRSAPARDFPLLCSNSTFTDDTVCSAAIADAILSGVSFEASLRSWCGRYPNAGYGGMFEGWLLAAIPNGYRSWGNGAPMRVSPCAWLARDDAEARLLATRSCEPTHGHEKAVSAARAVVLAIHAGMHGRPRHVLAEIWREVLGAEPHTQVELAGGLPRTVKALPTTVRALRCVLAAADFENAVRLAVLAGGDTDTTAAIAGSIAEAFMEIPHDLWERVSDRLPDEILELTKRVYPGALRAPGTPAALMVAAP